jgi:hypothetical protein
MYGTRNSVTTNKQKLQNGEFLPKYFGRAVVEAVVEAAVVVFCSEALFFTYVKNKRK